MGARATLDANVHKVRGDAGEPRLRAKTLDNHVPHAVGACQPKSYFAMAALGGKRSLETRYIAG